MSWSTRLKYSVVPDKILRSNERGLQRDKWKSEKDSVIRFMSSNIIINVTETEPYVLTDPFIIVGIL